MSEKKRPTGTREWASTSVNVMQGCAHDCRYCYARADKRRPHAGPWTTEQADIKSLNRKYGKRQGTVMFPTTHDITPDNLLFTIPVLRRLLEAGNHVLIVSKPHWEAVDTMLNQFQAFRSQVLFRFTIGSTHDETLQLWEPGAPLYEERLRCLAGAFGRGFATSVSMEPMLDTEENDIVSAFQAMVPFVTDCIWLGKMNHALERLTANGFGDDEALKNAALALVISQCDERILALYSRLKDEPKVKWKESIKQVVGINSPDEIGLDV
ncbi:MAG: hypothetical protein A2Y38_00380 [Spirochaetes bacterium GWB1_59_5]|nr:MAG: hypothetical protein A2Y38_00380 [Spirochaetes bacterium GWB1_59_5]